MSNDKLVDLENRIVQRLAWLREGSLIDVQAFTADIEAMLAQAHVAGADKEARLAKVREKAREYLTGAGAAPYRSSHAAEAAQEHETMTPRELAKRIERGEKWTLAGEAAQAQSQSSEWVMVPREPTRAMHQQITAGRLGGATNEVVWKSILAAAPQQAAEPMGWMASDNTGRVIDAKAKAAGSRAAATASATAIYSIPLYDIPQPQAAEPVAYALFTEKGLVRMWSRDWFGDPHSAVKHGAVPLYTHPQPAQDAKVVFAPPQTEEDVMAYLQIARLHVKRFREILQDAMAKESGR